MIMDAIAIPGVSLTSGSAVVEFGGTTTISADTISIAKIERTLPIKRDVRMIYLIEENTLVKEGCYQIDDTIREECKEQRDDIPFDDRLCFVEFF